MFYMRLLYTYNRATRSCHTKMPIVQEGIYPIGVSARVQLGDKRITPLLVLLSDILPPTVRAINVLRVTLISKSGLLQEGGC